MVGSFCCISLQHVIIWRARLSAAHRGGDPGEEAGGSCFLGERLGCCSCNEMALQRPENAVPDFQV